MAAMMETLDVLFVVCLTLSNIFGTSCVSKGKFSRIDGYMLSSGGPKFHYTTLSCGIRCFHNTSCLSFNYHVKTEECQFNIYSPYTKPLDVLQAPEWALYNLKRDNDWKLVFRAKAGNNLSPYHTWMGTSSPPTPVEDGCLLMTGTSNCTSIYRSHVLTTWDSESISEVKLEMYKDGNMTVNIRFNGTGSTYTNWFDHNRLIDSGWSTMSKNRTFNFFSLRGDCKRTFFVNEFYLICPKDLGWMIVIDPIVGSCPCGYDTQSDKPAFLFAQGDNVTRWENNDYGRADVLAVFIKRWLGHWNR
ncbi:uncharacterized protein LOC117342880 [Pecten maximus]|uniref:uncharacterized protein LOC117342880 n=1 Tax=Pecten maximus TaxID=6579 RepID=UPI001457F0FD|nr:uncharacterized protein LOC117342880 [Pecten maximus]